MPVSKTIEFIVGVFVILGLAAFLLLALKVSGLTTWGDEQGYRVTAQFSNIGGLKVQSPVSMAGVRIGRVVNIDIDTETFEAVVELALNPAYPIPEDSDASIFTAGLLGEQYIAVEPGGAEDYLKDGDRIKITQSALILERLIGEFLFNVNKSDNK